MPSLPARQGQAGPGRGTACAPLQAASTGLGSRQDKLGPQQGDRDRGRASGSVPLQGKYKKETATNPGAFICGRTNQTELGPNSHGTRARGIGKKKGTVHHPCTGQGTAFPSPSSLPCPTQGEAGNTHPALPGRPTAPRQAHRTLCFSSRCCPNITTPQPGFASATSYTGLIAPGTPRRRSASSAQCQQCPVGPAQDMQPHISCCRPGAHSPYLGFLTNTSS